MIGCVSDREELQWLITGHRPSAAITAAVSLGLVEELADGPRSSAELAADAGTDPDATHRLLRALATLGILEQADDAFALTEFGRPLLAGSPASLAPQAKIQADPAVWAAWGNLAHTVRTGETSFTALHGTDLWTHRARHPDHSHDFDDLMTTLSASVVDAVAASYDFSSRSHVVDVGGGQGSLVTAVLRRNPHLTGGVFDQAHVVSPAGPSELAGRWSSTTGSFFDEVPAADCYLLKWILHDWSDEECVEILSRCRESLADGGVVLVVELALGRPGHERQTAFMDINMMVGLGGRERTEAEYATLLDRAGLRLIRSLDTGTPYTLFEAVAAS
jgi:O-methyltransferase domain/Dimerisation domain